MTSDFWDTPEGKLGRAGEDIIRAWLKENGYYVVPAGYIENGGAPMLEGWVKNSILPDLLGFKNQMGVWVEVKTKTRPTYNRNRDRLEHGIPARHWKAYFEVQQNTGISGSLAILEASVGVLLLGELKAIESNAVLMSGEGTIKAYGESMMFFDNKAFKRIPLDALKYPMPPTIQPQVIRDWEHSEVQLNLFE